MQGQQPADQNRELRGLAVRLEELRRTEQRLVCSLQASIDATNRLLARIEETKPKGGRSSS